MPPRARGGAAAAKQASSPPPSGGSGKKKGGAKKAKGGAGGLASKWWAAAAVGAVALAAASRLVLDRSPSAGAPAAAPRPSRAPAEAFPVRVSRLKDWLAARNATVSPKVAAAERALGLDAAEGSDRGLEAAAAVEAGEVLVHVPEEALVRRSAVKVDPLAVEVYDVLVRHRDNCSSCTVRDRDCLRECRLLSSETNEEALGQIQLAVWVAKERHAPESPWRPWLDMLPMDFGFSPVALPEPLLKAAFKDTAVLKEAQELQEAWQTAHELLSRQSPLYGKHVGTYDEFLTARITVLSRVHGLPHTGDVIVPFVDLLNHDSQAPTWWGPSAKGGFELRATAPIAQGSPVTCSYGSERSSKELLLHYGFAPASNPFHSIELDLSPDRADGLYSAKRQGLIDMDLYRSFSYSEQLGFAKSRPVIAPTGWDNLEVREQDAYMFREVLLCLRICALTVKDLEANSGHKAAIFEQDEAAQARLRATGGTIGVALEGRVARRLEKAAAARLKPLGGESGRDAKGVLQALRAEAAAAGAAAGAAPSDQDLQQVAASAAALSATEASLFATLIAVARAVGGLAEAGRWPEGAGDLGENAADAAGRYVQLWARSFAEGVAASSSQP